MSSITILSSPTQIILNGILTSGEVADNTRIQSLKLRIRKTSREVSDNNPVKKPRSVTLVEYYMS